MSKSAVARGEAAVAQVAAEERIVAEVEAAQAAAGGNADADTLRPFMERLRSEAGPSTVSLSHFYTFRVGAQQTRTGHSTPQIGSQRLCIRG